MKLARKLTLAILSAMALVLAVNAYMRIERDGHLLREDVRRDHRTLARTLAGILPEIFRDDGDARAIALVETANLHNSQSTIRWVWPAEIQNARVRALLKAKRDGEVIASDANGDRLYTYVSVPLRDGRVGAIEVGESLAVEREHNRATVLRTIVTTLLIATLAAALTSWLGVWLVGKPVAQLMEKARRVGQGDLSGPLRIRQGGELDDLAREMNAMCERLDAESKARMHALEQLRHAERLGTLGRLSAGVAHELGTPLNVVRLEAKRIAVGRATAEEACQGANIIVEQTQRMSQIIEQLLDFARRRSPRIAPVELGEVAQESVSLLLSLARRQGVCLRYEKLGEARAAGDRGQLQQVIANLVVNAVQAMQDGGEVHIQTGTGRVARQADATAVPMAFVRVVDTGIGIPSDHIARIFEPFFTTKEVGQGTGLGLSVAHGIVEEHAGFIEVVSKEREGARFTVWLPEAA